MISYRRVPTHITPDIFVNFEQTFTVTGTLDSLGRPAAGLPLNFSTGRTHLCTAITNSHGVASCVLSYAKSVAIRHNAGRYTVSFSGTPGYRPSIAFGQAIIFLDRLAAPSGWPLRMTGRQPVPFVTTSSLAADPPSMPAGDELPPNRQAHR